MSEHDIVLGSYKFDKRDVIQCLQSDSTKFLFWCWHQNCIEHYESVCYQNKIVKSDAGVSFRYELILASLWFKLSWVFTSNIVDIRLGAWSRYVLTSGTRSIVSLCHDWSIVRDQVWSGMISSNGINYLGIMRTRANYYLTGVCTSVQCLYHCNSQCWHWTLSNMWKILFELHLLSIYICDSDTENYWSKYEIDFLSPLCMFEW